MNPTEAAPPANSSSHYTPPPGAYEDLSVFYVVSEVLVSIVAVAGNALVIAVFRRERRLRRRTNYYIVSLAAADFLVGILGIPFALLASMGLPRNLHACLFTVSLLVVLCTISIFCLVAVSVDRYWAILYPMAYSRHVRTKTALVIISICWFAGTIIGFLPLMGWHQDVPHDAQCFFLKVMDYNYLVFLYIVTIITPALLLAAFYTHIYRVVVQQVRQIVTMNPENGKTPSGGTMLRVLGAAQKREVKATQNLSVIVLFFMLCWIPLYTINFILAFCADCFEVNSTVMLFCIILSHLNSAGNPLLYAYHLKDFRAALKHFLCGGETNRQLIGITGVNGRNSLMSSNYAHHHRLQSLRHTRSALTLSPHSKYFSESQLSLEPQLSKSNSLPQPPKILTIVPNTAAVAAAPTTGEMARDIWRISEVPSVSEQPSKSRSETKRSTSETSGQINGGFVEMHPDFDIEEGDDDVFFDFPTTTPYEDTLPRTSSDSDDESAARPLAPTLYKYRSNCLSSSSPQLARNLFVVGADTDNASRASPPVRFGRSCSVVEPQQTHYFRPMNLVRLSPFKMVGELFRLKGARNSKSATKLHKTLSQNDNNSISVN